jgi:hypothetical protein
MGQLPTPTSVTAMEVTYRSEGWTVVGPNLEQRCLFEVFADGRRVLTLFPEKRRIQ